MSFNIARKWILVLAALGIALALVMGVASLGPVSGVAALGHPSAPRMMRRFGLGASGGGG